MPIYTKRDGGSLAPFGLSTLTGDIVVVDHGDDANVERPSAPVVYWRGTVTPVNAELSDLFFDTGN